MNQARQLLSTLSKRKRLAVILYGYWIVWSYKFREWKSKIRNSLVLVILVTFCTSTATHSVDLKYQNWIEVQYFIKYPKGSVTRNLVRSKTIPKDYLLAMIAIHECINVCKEDTPYIIESSYNRELLNWGNYGDIYGQILSTEFRGLIDKNFYFNPDNPKHLYALECARRILNGHKEVPNKYIVGWLTHYDSDSYHVKKAKKLVIATPTWHEFWTNE